MEDFFAAVKFIHLRCRWRLLAPGTFATDDCLLVPHFYFRFTVSFLRTTEPRSVRVVVYLIVKYVGTKFTILCNGQALIRRYYIAYLFLTQQGSAFTPQDVLGNAEDRTPLSLVPNDVHVMFESHHRMEPIRCHRNLVYQR